MIDDVVKFGNGAVRAKDDGKPRPELISPFAVERLGQLLAKGAVTYACRNWEAGMPISRCIASLERHIMQYKMGMTNEDHMAAAMCNAMFIIHYEAGIKHGFLNPDLDDMPHYLTTDAASQTSIPEPVDDTIRIPKEVRGRLRKAIVRGLFALARLLLRSA